MSVPAIKAALLAILALAIFGSYAAQAGAEGLSDDGGAEWRLEQPPPPAAPTGVEGAANVPISLGRIGGIAFWAPDRGALVTAGNGSTVKPGVWVYNGTSWHELATVCGASVGSRVSPPNPTGSTAPISPGFIAWAGPDEFWTISDGRTGQAAEQLGHTPPLEDNTLCHFELNPTSGELEVVKSYASLAFQSTSYEAMNAAACFSASDCWFAGEPLEAPQIGTFQLHWNGHTITPEPYLPEGHAVGDMTAFPAFDAASAGSSNTPQGLYESVRLEARDRILKSAGGVGEEPALHLIDPDGALPSFEALLELPLLGSGPCPPPQSPQSRCAEFPEALDFLHLGADEDALWGAAGPAYVAPAKSGAAGVTIVRYSKSQYSSESDEYVEEAAPSWTQVIGPSTTPRGEEDFPEDVVNSIAAEPSTNRAWMALDSREDARTPSPFARASVARVSADGSVSDETQLPGTKGAAERIVCPAVHDCWMTTTQGWLFHLSTSTEREHPETNAEPAFSGAYLVTERPADEGVPRAAPYALAEDDSGLVESEPLRNAAALKPALVNPFATVTLPLLSDVHTRLIHRTTLVLSFHLSVKASVRLLAKRKAKLVASTSKRTLQAGNRSLELRLNIHRWPTKLKLETHALAPLKTASTRESSSSTDTVTSSLAFPGTRVLSQSGLLP
jgi:hypothetical protein